MAGWYNGIRPEDTCPECNRADADQVTENNKVMLYMCQCGHEWSPSVAVGFEFKKVAVHDSIPVADVDPEAVARIQRQVLRSLMRL